MSVNIWRSEINYFGERLVSWDVNGEVSVKNDRRRESEGVACCHDSWWECAAAVWFALNTGSLLPSPFLTP